MFCQKCGRTIGAEQNFCWACGTAIQRMPVQEKKQATGGDAEFIFEKTLGKAVFIRGLRKVYRTKITCTEDTVHIIQTKGKYQANEAKPIHQSYNRSHIVSVRCMKKIEIIPTFATIVLIIATFVLSPYFAVLALFSFLAMFSDLLRIRLINGEKIDIRYAKSDPYQDFLTYIL